MILLAADYNNPAITRLDLGTGWSRLVWNGGSMICDDLRLNDVTLWLTMHGHKVYGFVFQITSLFQEVTLMHADPVNGLFPCAIGSGQTMAPSHTPPEWTFLIRTKTCGNMRNATLLPC